MNEHADAAVAGADPEDRLAALIGGWKTRGEVLGDDGETPVATVDGHDDYERLGQVFVVHRIDVDIAGDRVQGLEMIGPWLPEEGAFATRAYDHEGSEQASIAVANDDGRVWSFGADQAQATLTIADHGGVATADWVRTDDRGATWRPWMRLTLVRETETAPRSRNH